MAAGIVFLGLGLALALIVGGLVTLVLLVVVAVVDRTVIQREERYLRNLFGDAYTRYAANTRRWL